MEPSGTREAFISVVAICWKGEKALEHTSPPPPHTFLIYTEAINNLSLLRLQSIVSSNHHSGGQGDPV